MRALGLLNFVLAVVAITLAYMGYSRVETARTTALEAAEGLDATEQKVDRRLSETEQRILDQVTAHARAEAGGVEAKLSTRLSEVQADLTRDMRTLADGLAGVSSGKDGSREQVLESLEELDGKIADLKARVEEGDKDVELRKRVAALEQEFARWLEIVLPPEVVDAP